ncbi:hypothetical protein MNV49_006414 [Pseudohyphozyma bogoriensis]|nr:hypothetical protein MNV49_006414 [Pseudohyphozyma bogoriensis]
MSKLRKPTTKPTQDRPFLHVKFGEGRPPEFATQQRFAHQLALLPVDQLHLPEGLKTDVQREGIGRYLMNNFKAGSPVYTVVHEREGDYSSYILVTANWHRSAGDNKLHLSLYVYREDKHVATWHAYTDRSLSTSRPAAARPPTTTSYVPSAELPDAQPAYTPKKSRANEEIVPARLDRPTAAPPEREEQEYEEEEHDDDPSVASFSRADVRTYSDEESEGPVEEYEQERPRDTRNPHARAPVVAHTRTSSTAAAQAEKEDKPAPATNGWDEPPPEEDRPPTPEDEWIQPPPTEGFDRLFESDKRSPREHQHQHSDDGGRTIFEASAVVVDSRLAQSLALPTANKISPRAASPFALSKAGALAFTASCSHQISPAAPAQRTVALSFQIAFASASSSTSAKVDSSGLKVSLASSASPSSSFTVSIPFASSTSLDEEELAREICLASSDQDAPPELVSGGQKPNLDPSRSRIPEGEAQAATVKSAVGGWFTGLGEAIKTKVAAASAPKQDTPAEEEEEEGEASAEERRQRREERRKRREARRKRRDEREAAATEAEQTDREGKSSRKGEDATDFDDTDFEDRKSSRKSRAAATDVDETDAEVSSRKERRSRTRDDVEQVVEAVERRSDRKRADTDAEQSEVEDRRSRRRSHKSGAHTDIESDGEHSRRSRSKRKDTDLEDESSRRRSRRQAESDEEDAQPEAPRPPARQRAMSLSASMSAGVTAIRESVSKAAEAVAAKAEAAKQEAARAKAKAEKEAAELLAKEEAEAERLEEEMRAKEEELRREKEKERERRRLRDEERSSRKSRDKGSRTDVEDDREAEPAERESRRRSKPKPSRSNTRNDESDFAAHNSRRGVDTSDDEARSTRRRDEDSDAPPPSSSRSRREDEESSRRDSCKKPNSYADTTDAEDSEAPSRRSRRSRRDGDDSEADQSRRDRRRDGEDSDAPAKSRDRRSRKKKEETTESETEMDRVAKLNTKVNSSTITAEELAASRRHAEPPSPSANFPSSVRAELRRVQASQPKSPTPSRPPQASPVEELENIAATRFQGAPDLTDGSGRALGEGGRRYGSPPAPPNIRLASDDEDMPSNFRNHQPTSASHSRARPTPSRSLSYAAPSAPTEEEESDYDSPRPDPRGGPRANSWFPPSDPGFLAPGLRSFTASPDIGAPPMASLASMVPRPPSPLVEETRRPTRSYAPSIESESEDNEGFDGSGGHDPYEAHTAASSRHHHGSSRSSARDMPPPSSRYRQPQAPPMASSRYGGPPPRIPSPQPPPPPPSSHRNGRHRHRKDTSSDDDSDNAKFEPSTKASSGFPQSDPDSDFGPPPTRGGGRGRDYYAGPDHDDAEEGAYPLPPSHRSGPVNDLPPPSRDFRGVGMGLARDMPPPPAPIQGSHRRDKSFSRSVPSYPITDGESDSDDDDGGRRPPSFPSRGQTALADPSDSDSDDLYRMPSQSRAPRTQSVLFETSLGDIIVDLETSLCPTLSLNFLKLCKSYYYNFNSFHNVILDFIAQTGDPTDTGSGGSSIFNLLPPSSPAYSSSKYFVPETSPKLKHVAVGTLSMAIAGEGDNRGCGSQFFFTLAPGLEYLDGKHAPFGRVVEGEETLTKINEALTDGEGKPLRDIRIRHVIVLDDPFPDPEGLVVAPNSPVPTAAQLSSLRVGDEEELEETGDPETLEAARKARDAKAQALTLEMVGDLPFADVAPPENVLFVCKLNQVTKSEDLELIFSRFGTILSCEIIRDMKTGDSLQYAFIEFKEREDAERAYVKMDNVLVDDRRIHVDFSQSVSKLHNSWVFDRTGMLPFNETIPTLLTLHSF